VFGFFALLRAGLRDNIGEPTEVLAVFAGEDGAAKRKAVLDGWEQLLASRNRIRMNADIPLPDPPTGHPSRQLPPAATIVEELGLW
jgi:hypothetical protein